MKYVNEKTGVTIETKNKISGGNWKLVVDKKTEPKKSSGGK